MKIGIFGGAFNPPHIGHVESANSAVFLHDLDKLIVIPTGKPPHKRLPPGTPEPDKRLQMTINAFTDSKNTFVSDMEVNSSLSNYTIDTVNSIQNEYPESKIFMLVGTDMYDSLGEWKDSELLLQKVTPVLLPRDIINISSSEVRKLLPERKGREYVDDTNYALIIKHRLYGAKPDWDWLREQAHAMLDPLRIPHVEACEVEAVRLAEHWGEEPDAAREAAILHDITKKLDFSQNMCIIAEHGITIGKLGDKEEKLLHSITGALLAQSMYGVSTNVSDAIKWHTTGRGGMTVLEKIIYIADYIESTRDFAGVEELRRGAYWDIDKAMVIGLEMTVSDLKSRGIAPNAATFDALNDLSS